MDAKRFRDVETHNISRTVRRWYCNYSTPLCSRRSLPFGAPYSGGNENGRLRRDARRDQRTRYLLSRGRFGVWRLSRKSASDADERVSYEWIAKLSYIRVHMVLCKGNKNYPQVSREVIERYTYLYSRIGSTRRNKLLQFSRGPARGDPANGKRVILVKTKRPHACLHLWPDSRGVVFQERFHQIVTIAKRTARRLYNKNDSKTCLDMYLSYLTFSSHECKRKTHWCGKIWSNVAGEGYRYYTYVRKRDYQ